LLVSCFLLLVSGFLVFWFSGFLVFWFSGLRLRREVEHEQVQ